VKTQKIVFQLVAVTTQNAKTEKFAVVDNAQLLVRMVKRVVVVVITVHLVRLALIVHLGAEAYVIVVQEIFAAMIYVFLPVRTENVQTVRVDAVQQDSVVAVGMVAVQKEPVLMVLVAKDLLFVVVIAVKIMEMVWDVVEITVPAFLAKTVATIPVSMREMVWDVV
jgi:hypothetical protein